MGHLATAGLKLHSWEQLTLQFGIKSWFADLGLEPVSFL